MKKYGSKLTAVVLVLFLTAAVLFTTQTVAYAAEENVSAAETVSQEAVEISDAQGMLAIADAPEGNYRLTADIDMSTLDWTPVAFSGTLDGAGHTLYNLHVTKTGNDTRITKDGNLKVYETKFVGLFSVAEKANIHDLNVVGAEISAESDTNCFAAILTGYTDDSRFSNCKVQGRVHLINHCINAGVAGIAGYGWGVFDECSADVELVFEDRYRDAHCEEFMGGVLSCGMATIRNCNVTIEGYDSCHGYVHNGGVVGMYFHCGVRYPERDVLGNRVKGQITFFEDNWDRRAYCSWIIGERLSGCHIYTDNGGKFKRNETFNYKVVLLPETCEEPHYTETVTPPDCTNWGYTEHVCDGCGYHWTDTYTPPHHDFGEWEDTGRVSETGGKIQQRICKACQATEEREVFVIMKPTEPRKEFPLGMAVAIGGAGFLVLAAAVTGTVLFLRKKRK